MTCVSARAAEGEIYEIALPEAAPVEVPAEPIPLDVVYEDDTLIVVNKPAGMVVHPAPGTPRGTLVNALLAHCGDGLSGIGGEKRPGIVHRIDKNTTGLLVAAKNDAAHRALAGQFEKHAAERCYLAAVRGVPDAGDPRLRGLEGADFEPNGILRIETMLRRHRTDRQRQAVDFVNGRRAVTRAETVERYGSPSSAALLSCRLETGRTHQIRAHLAYVGHGLIGDPVYGGGRRLSPEALGEVAATAATGFPRQALHAAQLGFVHPGNGQILRFEAPPPPDMEALLDALRAAPRGATALDSKARKALRRKPQPVSLNPGSPKP